MKPVPPYQSSPDWPRKVASALDSLERDKITQPEADARYVRQDIGLAWTAATGTASRTALAAYAGQIVSNPPTQAQVQAIDDAVKAQGQALVALINDLRANGALT